MNEIDQRNKDKILIQCHCGGSHFIMFDYYYDEDYKYFYAQIIDQSDSLWERIKKGLKFIFKGGDLYYMDVGLTESDLDKLILLFNSYKRIKKEEE